MPNLNFRINECQLLDVIKYNVDNISDDVKVKIIELLLGTSSVRADLRDTGRVTTSPQRDEEVIANVDPQECLEIIHLPRQIKSEVLEVKSNSKGKTKIVSKGISKSNKGSKVTKQNETLNSSDGEDLIKPKTDSIDMAKTKIMPDPNLPIDIEDYDINNFVKIKSNPFKDCVLIDNDKFITKDELTLLSNLKVLLKNGEEASLRILLDMSKNAWSNIKANSKRLDISPLEYIRERELTHLPTDLKETSKTPKTKQKSEESEVESLRVKLGLNTNQWRNILVKARKYDMTPEEYFNSDIRNRVNVNTSKRVELGLSKTQWRSMMKICKERNITIENYLAQKGKGSQHVKNQIISDFKSKKLQTV